jgi:Tol biopolymer transport system component
LGASLSPDGNNLLYTYETGQGDDADYSIRMMNLTTGKTTEIGKGQYPLWSPSGEWIAYLDSAAMYVMKADGTQNKLVTPTGYNSGWLSKVTMSWSPDDRFIVYDRPGEDLQVRNIYVVEVATGKDNMIAAGGIQPFWRKK